MIKYVKDLKINIYKIDVYSLEKIELFSVFLDNRYPNKCKAYVSDKRFAEFVSIDAGKNNAYVALKNYYKFENSQIIVVGDALNDLGLFEHATNRVAVSNAINDILEASTYIVENKDYCGICRLIYKILKDDEIWKFIMIFMEKSQLNK